MSLLLLVVMRHLQSCSFKATFDIEPLIGLTAVQNTLIAANLLCNEIERLDDLQSELLALLILGYCNILNVPDDA